MSAICPVCKQEKKQQGGCSGTKVVGLDAEGTEFDRIRYGDEPHRAIQSAFEAGGGKGFEMFLNEDGRQAKTAAEVIGEIQRFSLLNFCSDCKVAVGALHHEGCEREECPRCGRPARSCQCPDGDPV